MAAQQPTIVDDWGTPQDDLRTEQSFTIVRTNPEDSSDGLSVSTRNVQEIPTKQGFMRTLYRVIQEFWTESDGLGNLVWIQDEP